MSDSEPSRRRRRASHKPLPVLSASSKNTVFPAVSRVLLSCTCSSGSPMEHASPERSDKPSAGDAANITASGMGIAMPNSTAAGSIAAGALLALGEPVEVPVGDEPAEEHADGLSVSSADAGAVPDGEPVGDRVRAGVRDTDVEAVPVCDDDGVLEPLPVTDEDGVTLLEGLELPVPEEDTPAVSEPEGVPVVLTVCAAVPEAVWLVVDPGEPLRLLLVVSLLVLVGELLGRAVLEPVAVGLGVRVVEVGGVDDSEAVADGVADAEPVPDAVAEGSTPEDSDAVAVALSLQVAVAVAKLLAVPVMDGRGVFDADLDFERLRDTVLVKLDEAVALKLREPVPVALVEGVPVALLDPVPEALGDALRVWLLDALAVMVPVIEPVSVPVMLPVEVAVAVSLRLGDELELGEPVGLLVLVALIVAVPVALGKAVPVALVEPVPVALLEPVPVALVEGVPVALLEPVPEALGDALRV